MIILVLLTLTACESGSSGKYAVIDKELKTLTTNEKKRDYLQKILVIDQQFRKGQEDQLRVKGMDTKEYKDFMANRTKLDQENYVKIDRYIEMYGHPKPFDVSLNLTAVPITVITHGGNFDEQSKHFPALHQAYRKGYFTNYIFVKYLKGMHQLKFGTYHKMKSPYTEEEEIEELQRVLGLELTNKK